MFVVLRMPFYSIEYSPDMISCLCLLWSEGKILWEREASWLKLFVDAVDDVINAFTALGQEDLSEDNLRVLEKCACRAFCNAKRRIHILAIAMRLFADHLMVVRCFH